MLTSSDMVSHILQRGTKTCEWLTGTIYTVNGTDIGYQGWCNTLFLHYIIEPVDLPTSCDGYGAAFFISISVYYAL